MGLRAAAAPAVCSTLVAYPWLKLLHLLAVVAWIGPPLGAYYFIGQAYRSGDRDRILWTERVVERVLIAEHVAFAVLIASGWAMVVYGPWQLSTPWLQNKLLLFAGVVVFELFDMWLAHRVFPRALEGDAALDQPPWKRAERLRRWLVAAAVPVALGLIPGIFYFAVLKP